MLLSVGSGSNVALDMFPVAFIKGGLEEWIKTRPLGATWDTEERRADVLSFNPDGTNEPARREAHGMQEGALRSALALR
jgi:hypothetical protein